MSKTMDLSGKLDFTEIDLTAPNIVIEDFLSQLPEQTHDIIFGKVEPYSGHIVSYTKPGIASYFDLNTSAREVDIQNDLGVRGYENRKFECYIYTPIYDHFKFRIFFLEFGVANYPVTLVLEEKVAQSVSDLGTMYVTKCDNRDELEDLLEEIFNSKRLVSIMQEIIRIYQAKKSDSQSLSVDEENSFEQ